MSASRFLTTKLFTVFLQPWDILQSARPWQDPLKLKAKFSALQSVNACLRLSPTMPSRSATRRRQAPARKRSQHVAGQALPGLDHRRLPEQQQQQQHRRRPLESIPASQDRREQARGEAILEWQRLTNVYCLGLRGHVAENACEQQLVSSADGFLRRHRRRQFGRESVGLSGKLTQGDERDSTKMPTHIWHNVTYCGPPVTISVTFRNDCYSFAFYRRRRLRH